MQTIGLRPLLREDPELAYAVPDQTRADAGPRVLVEMLELDRQSPAPDLEVAARRSGLGLLVLAGLLLRRVEVMSKLSYELLGPGDLVPAKDEEPEADLLPFEVSWKALDDVRLAVLDDAFVDRAAPWPWLSNAIVTRGLRRASSVTLERALTQHRVDVRIDLLLWHLAGRWGKVVGDGLIRLPLRVTHEIIAHVAGCSRPTATSTLGRLAELHLIQAETRGWLIQGSLQSHLVRLGAGDPRR